jgi:hypothetical protein
VPAWARWATVLAVLCAGCRGWQGNTYYAHRLPKKRADKEATYRFGSPGDDWRALRKVDDVQVAWVHDEYRAVIELHAQCDDQGDSSLDEYTDHLRIDWTHWDIELEEPGTFAGRASLRTVVTARLDGVPMKLELLVFKKDGCLFDLRYATSPKSYDAGRAAFVRVTDGFKFPVRG